MMKASYKGLHGLRVFVTALTVLILSFGVICQSQADTVSTSFEGLPSGDFTIGTSPITATFTSGTALTVGVPENYHTGLYSWHVHASTPAVISFETPASNIRLWIKNH